MRKHKNKNTTRKIVTRKRILFFCFAFIFLALLVGIALTRVPESFTIVGSQGGEIKLTLFDFAENRLVHVNIPKETQVNLAMKKGTLRAESIDKLILAESLPGQLLADSVMKTFHLPVDYWAAHESYGTFWGGDVPLSTSLAIFSRNLRGMRLESIDLADSSLLTKKRLIDGEDGYIVESDVPLGLVSLFSDPIISKEQTTLRLVNSTGEGNYTLTPAVDVLEVLGVKPVPPLETEAVDIDCIVKSDSAYALERIASVLNCEVSQMAPGAFDIELVVGSRFLDRF